MMKKRLLGILVGLTIFCLADLAQASLTHVGWASYDDGSANIGAYKLIYDDDFQITWLDYIKPRDLWQNQMNWAASLNDPDALQYYLFDGITMNWAGEYWRLPYGGGDPDPEYGFNVHSSELGHLYYDELGLSAMISYEYVTDAELNASEFDNLVGGWYWFETPAEVDDGEIVYAMSFGLHEGRQAQTLAEVHSLYGLAVRSGEVSQVPLPGSFVLLTTGMVGMVTVWRRRNGNHH